MRNCPKDKVKTCITKGRKVCPAKCDGDKRSKECMRKKSVEPRKKTVESRISKKAIVQSDSDLRFIPCATFCSKKRNSKECKTACEKNQRETIRQWHKSNRCRTACRSEKFEECMKHGTKVCATKHVQLADSDLRLMPCSMVCENRKDKAKCFRECEENHKRATETWNQMIKKQKRFAATADHRRGSTDSISADSDLSLVSCGDVCANRNDKDVCHAKCKEDQQKAINQWNKMIHKQRLNNKVLSESELRLLPCERLCENKDKSCFVKCKENQQKIIATWLGMQRKD